MKPWETLDATTLPDGSELLLRHHDGEYVLWLNGYDLMSSRQHGSEERLAELTCGGLSERKRRGVGDETVLIGGLGLGYTLRAALDRLPPRGTAVVAEILPAVVEWNRGVLAPLAGNPLSDRRTRVEERDVREIIEDTRGAFDAILLDVDNGPGSFSQPENRRLYTRQGLINIHRALRPGGRVGVWSSTHEPEFLTALGKAGFKANEYRAGARGVKRGPRHWLYIGKSG
jgi:spermidine synthase